MPFHYTIDPTAKLIHLRLSGRVDLPMLLSVRLAVRADPLFDPTMPALVDATAVEALALNLEDVMLLEPPPETIQPPMAIVAKTTAQQELAQVFSVVRSSRLDTLVTPYMDEAIAWLQGYVDDGSPQG